MPAPNILLFICDHLSPLVMGAYGNDSGVTEAMDSVAKRGVTFGRAYTTCPLCQPARASFWSGLLPHQTQVRSNGKLHQNVPLPEDIPMLGRLFSAAGYDAFHFGKRHDFGTLDGFSNIPAQAQKSPEIPEAWPENYDTELDNSTVAQVNEWLKQPKPKPFLAVADFNNPHNICGWVGANDSTAGPVTPVPVSVPLPPLPDNFQVQDFTDRPLPVQYICCSHRRQRMASQWTEEMFRYYLAAYNHYTDLVDGMIGRTLRTLAESGLAENTIIIIMADHGDGLARHGHVTKQVSLYDQTTRIPLIFAGPGIERRGRDNVSLISLLDLLPTLCDLADIQTPGGLDGRSLKPLLSENQTPAAMTAHHDYVVSEWHTEWGFTISPGRMLRTPQFKYNCYLEANGEELFDMNADPGETRTLHNDPAYREILEQHRNLLEQHLKHTGDDFRELTVKADPRWRRHKPGYRNHRGICAPTAGEQEEQSKS